MSNIIISIGVRRRREEDDGDAALDDDNVGGRRGLVPWPPDRDLRQRLEAASERNDLCFVCTVSDVTSAAPP